MVLVPPTAENTLLELSKWRLVFSDLTPQVSYSTDFAFLRRIQRNIFSLDLTRQKHEIAQNLAFSTDLLKFWAVAPPGFGTLKGR
jgi:hypothetical protein